VRGRDYTLALLVALIVALVVVAVVTTRSDGAANRSQPTRIEGVGIKGWHLRAVRNRRTINSLRRVQLGDGNVVEAINLACATYGNCASLWRKARCESHYRAAAHNNSGAAGLFQFLPSTWRSTPYGRFSVYSAYANALAAGWMHEHGRGGEWVCR
jgi:hypothetical protein